MRHTAEFGFVSVAGAPPQCGPNTSPTTASSPVCHSLSPQPGGSGQPCTYGAPCAGGRDGTAHGCERAVPLAVSNGEWAAGANGLAEWHCGADVLLIAACYSFPWNRLHSHGPTEVQTPASRSRSLSVCRIPHHLLSGSGAEEVSPRAGASCPGTATLLNAIFQAVPFPAVCCSDTLSFRTAIVVPNAKVIYCKPMRCSVPHQGKPYISTNSESVTNNRNLHTFKEGRDLVTDRVLDRVSKKDAWYLCMFALDACKQDGFTTVSPCRKYDVPSGTFKLYGHVLNEISATSMTPKLVN